MKKFLFKAFLLLFVIFLFYGFIFTMKPAESFGGAYVRVSSPQYPSLILGSSSAARGLSPAVAQQLLGDCYQFPMMNFSFDIGTSAVGEIYYNRISEKLKENKNKNSLFLVSVDPYVIGDYEIKEINDNVKREENGVLAQLKSVTSQPNWDYFFKNIFFSKEFVKLNFDEQKSGCDEYGFDGSLLNMETDPEWKVRERIEKQILPWYEKDVIPNYRFSEERLSYLTKIVSLLKKNGNVFLIRMPFEAELFEITDSVYPNFDEYMQNFAIENNVRYISFWETPSNYKTTDGVHLYKIEAERITRDICDSIKTQINY